MLNEFNEKLKNAQNLSLSQAADLCATFLEEDLTDAAIAETLVLLAQKGETADEICGFAQALLQRAAPVPFDHDTVDVCGTGGSDLERFNVSTAAAFVLACAGLCVAKHGNRGSKRPNGSFDLLEALEVPFQLNGDQVVQCLKQTGIGFLFARSFHPTMRKVVEARRQAKRRTIFNLAAPLCNPTQLAYQLVGTAARPMGPILAQSCIRLGRPQGCVVWGAPQIDELSVSGPSALFHFADGVIQENTIDATSTGIAPLSYDQIPHGDAPQNAEIFKALINGDPCSGVQAMVLLNAGFVLHATSHAATLKEGIHSAKKIILSGDMQRKFHDYRQLAIKLTDQAK